MWEGSDTVCLISCILGTILLFIPLSSDALILVCLIGGAGALIMGIIAIAKGSKIGIGGIILGALLILIGLIYPYVIHLPGM